MSLAICADLNRSDIVLECFFLRSRLGAGRVILLDSEFKISAISKPLLEGFKIPEEEMDSVLADWAQMQADELVPEFTETYAARQTLEGDDEILLEA